MHRDEATVLANVYRDNNTPTAKAAHKVSIKMAIEELLGADTGDFLDNNEISEDQLYQLQDTLNNMDQGHVNLTTENCTGTRCHKCTTAEGKYDQRVNSNLDDIIDTILPPQSSKDKNTEDLLPPCDKNS